MVGWLVGWLVGDGVSEEEKEGLRAGKLSVCIVGRLPYDYPSTLVGGIDDVNALILFIESRIQTAQIKLYYLKAGTGTYIQRSSVVL